MQLLIFGICLCAFFVSSIAQAGREAFQITSGSKAYLSASDIFRFSPSEYTGAPWNFDTTKLLTTDFQKSVAFWIRHNMTTPPTVEVPVIKGASKESRFFPFNPSVALEAHFYAILAGNGANTEMRLKYFATATPNKAYTIVSGTTLKPYVWYGVFISRRSITTSEAGVLFIYDTSVSYTPYFQTQAEAPAGLTPTPPTSGFYIDVGGDLTGNKPCACEISNVNFFYNTFYTTTNDDMIEYLKQAPRVLLSLEFRERDSTIELIEDLSANSYVVFRGDSQYDSNKNTPLNYDQTANGDLGHIYTQDAFDTIYPAFDLGKEFAISFWIRFDTKPASVSDDTNQYVFFKQNSQYTQLQVIVGFETTATTVTKMILQSGATKVTPSLNAMTRGSTSNWHYFYVYMGNLPKNDSMGTFHPTTLYKIIYLDDTPAIQTLTGTVADSWFDGGTTDIMRIGMGEDGEPHSLYGVLKKFQIFSGGWLAKATAGECDYYIGTPTLHHITQGTVLSSIICLTCSGTNNLYSDTCHAACPSGSYQVSDTNYLHCEDCYYNCETCSGRKPTMCSACIIGNWDPFGALTCPGANPCTIHQYFDGLACQECDDSCASCPSDSQCSACAKGLDYNLETHQCEVAVCGDGKVNAGEQCDDGNLFDGDGCSTECTIEFGWYCPSSGGSCYSICGDNVRASNEECDDGNNANEDGCSYDCKVEPGYYCTVPATPGPFFGGAYKETCSLCDNSFCTKCLDATTCAECTTGKFLDDGTCVDTCATPATYQNSTTLKCEPCPEFCSSCTNSTVCTECSGTNSLLNDACYEFCPGGMYSDVDTDGLRKCFTCDPTCITCSSATYCYTCPPNRFLNIQSGTTATCDLCDSSCMTCKGPLDTDCTLCHPEYTYQPSTSKCLFLTCESNEFIDLENGQCSPCDSSCKTCNGGTANDCLTCPTGKFLSSEGRCIECTSANGLIPLANGGCAEICGDGRHVLKSTGCDDGNILPFDGCSNECIVEDGWECTGGNETSPDTCKTSAAPRAIIVTDAKNPNIMLIRFNKKVTNNIRDFQMYNDLIIDIEGLNEDDSPYTLTYDSRSQVYTVEFTFKKSVIDAYVSVEFRYPHKIVDSFGNTVIPRTTAKFPTFYYISPETIDAGDNLAVFDYICQSFTAIAFIPLAIQGKLSYFWMYMEFFQLVNYVIYVNVRHPYISEKFMKSFSPLQLKWLPNIPKYLDIKYDKQAQATEDRFYQEDKDAFFLENAGTQLTIWAFSILVYLGARIAKSYMHTYESQLTRNFVRGLLEFAQWTLLLRAIVAMFFDFSLDSFLSVDNTGFEKGALTGSTVLGIIGVAFVAIFPIFVFFRIRKLHNKGLLDTDKKTITLHQDFGRESKISSHFIVIILLQKIAFAAVLVWLQTSAEAQITLLIIIEIIMVIIYLVWRPYSELSMNARAIWQEFSLFAALCMLYGVLDKEAEDSVRNEAGRIIVALLMSTLLMHTIFIVREAFVFSYNYLKGDIKSLSRQKYIRRKMIEAKRAKLKALKEQTVKQNIKIDVQGATERPEMMDVAEDQRLLKVEVRPNSRSDAGNKSNISILPKIQDNK